MFLKKYSVIVVVCFLFVIVSPGVSLATNNTPDISLLSQVEGDFLIGMDWSLDGNLIAVAWVNQGVFLYTPGFVEVGHINIATYSPPKFSPDGDLLAVPTFDEHLIIQIWSIEPLVLVKTLDLTPRDFASVSWSPDGQFLAVGGAEIGEIWNVQSGELVAQLDIGAPPRSNLFTVMEWHPSEAKLATNTNEDTTAIWDTDTATVLEVFEPRGDTGWNPDGTEIAIGTYEDIYVIDFETYQTIMVYELGTVYIDDLIWRGDVIASIHPVTGDHSLVTIKATNVVVGQTVDVAMLPVSNRVAALSPDGKQVAYVNASGELEIALIVFQLPSNCNVTAHSISILTNEIVAANDSGVPTSICLTENGTYALTDQLPDITGDITIVGNGATLQRESTAPQFRLLEVEATGVLTLNDLSLTGGDHSGAGGALQNEGGQVVINNVTFSNNHSDTTGGAIDQLETEGATGSMTINDSTFINNSATYAGAIDNDRGNVLTINNSVFTGNQAQFYAGAIHNDDATLTINDSQFSNNSAPETGGAIKSDDESTLIITNSTLDHNTAGDGAAIRNSGSLTITGTQITDNTATDWGGGLFSSSSGTVDITGTTFSGNTAVDGGAIRNHGHLTLTQSTVESNSASDNGGAFVVAGASSTTLTDCQVLNNSAAIDGGAIHSADSSSTVTIDDSVFTGNTATEDGGAIHVQPGVFIITDSQFTLNHAGDDGGAIYDNGSTTISGSEFGNNSADDGGGAIRVNENVSITSSYLHDNSAGGSGGAVDNNDTLTITDSEIANNQAVTRGGAVYNSYGGTATVNNSCITGNATISVESSSSVDPDFTNNWWGAADGPSGDGPGSGDSIDDDVLYVPFITTGCPH